MHDQERHSQYNIKLVECGNRLELYHYAVPILEDRINNTEGRKGKHAESERDKAGNRRKVLNKARNQIIRLANCNQDMTSFVTLTYADNMQDLKQSKKDLEKCIRLLQKDYKGFKYLYVLEFQARGAIHYHMLCNMPVLIKTAKKGHRKPQKQKDLENEFRLDYWPNGWCDIRNLETEGNTNAGLYVSSYLVEDLYKLDLQGGKCYGYSRNLTKPNITRCYQGMTHLDVIREFSEAYDIKYISNYQIQYQSGVRSCHNNVNYFDMYVRGNSNASTEQDGCNE